MTTINKAVLESRILDFVEVNYGLKGVELSNKVMSFDLTIPYNDVMDIIFDMIQDGKLVEIELVFPNNVSKSFILPKNTRINVIRRK